jgi:hypothetical protein
MMTVRLAAFVLLATLAPAQKSLVTSSAKPQPSPAEPSLPVINYNACPFEGCSFRKWTVNRKSKMYSSWQNNRHEVATLNAREGVTGLTGVLVIRKPDRFLVRRPIPYFSLKAGDVILQYAEWGEGYADLWANGVWHKDFDWGQTEDGDVNLTSGGFAQPQILEDDNVTLVQHGIKEWWVQVKRVDGNTGWVLADKNFDGMDALGDPPAKDHILRRSPQTD